MNQFALNRYYYNPLTDFCRQKLMFTKKYQTKIHNIGLVLLLLLEYIQNGFDMTSKQLIFIIQ